VAGARWQGVSDAPIAEGEPIEVIEALHRPMRLRVKRAGG
jgi:membrane-bound ClpP family serine protease